MTTDVSGDFSMRSDNRLRYWVAGRKIDQETKTGVVCDGTTLRRRDKQGPIDEKCPAKLSDDFRTVLRVGGLYASFANGFAKVATAVDGWKSSGYKKLDDDKIGEKTCRVLRFALETEMKKEQFIVKVWLDAETHLPLKRVVTGGDDQIEMTMTELWESISIDVEIPDEDFTFEK